MFALVGCPQADVPNAVDATKPAIAETSAAPLPWRYGPVLTASVPAGTVAEPVLEVADGVVGRARIVVAVAGGEAPARLEIWDFSQRNPRDRLERVDAPVVLLDLDPSAAAVADEVVARLRQDMASPSSDSVRLVGLVVPGEPATLVAELARLAAVALSTGPGRAQALAGLTRGLDDRLLWSSQLPGLVRRIGKWEVGAATPVGARRVQVTAREGDKELRLELTRTQERWVLSDVAEAQPGSSAPAAEPSPTAP